MVCVNVAWLTFQAPCCDVKASAVDYDGAVTYLLTASENGVLAAQGPVSGAGDGPEVAPTEGSGLPASALTSKGSAAVMAESSKLFSDNGDYEELALIGNGKTSCGIFKYKSCFSEHRSHPSLNAVFWTSCTRNFVTVLYCDYTNPGHLRSCC